MALKIAYNNYDDWKTSPPEIKEKPAARCEGCGRDLYGGETAYKLDGWFYCDNCVEYTTLDYI